MKKLISVFVCATLFLVGGYAVQVNRAHAVTLSELVELLVQLNIIPAENAVQAHAVVLPPAEDAELNIALDASNPSPSIIKISDTSTTDGQTVLVLDLDARNNSVEMSSLPIKFDIGGSDFNHVVNSVQLEVNGVVYNDYSLLYGDTSSAIAMFTFGPSDFIIPTTDATKVKVIVSFKPRATNYENGTTLKASLTDAQHGLTYTDNPFDLVKGTAIGNTQLLMVSGIFAERVLTSVTTFTDVNGTPHTGSFTIRFDVTAFDDAFYVSATNTAVVQYHVENVEGPVTVGSSTVALSSTATQESGSYRINDGKTERFSFFTLLSPSTTGFYRVKLDSLTFGNSAALPYGLSIPLSPGEGFTTDYLNLSGGAGTVTTLSLPPVTPVATTTDFTTLDTSMANGFLHLGNPLLNASTSSSSPRGILSETLHEAYAVRANINTSQGQADDEAHVVDTAVTASEAAIVPRPDLSHLTLSDLVELFITLDIIPTENADAARAAITTTPEPAPTPTPTGGSGGGGGSSHHGGGGGGRSSGSSSHTATAVVATTTPTSTPTVTGQVLGTETFKFLMDLHMGMQHNDVVELQKRLRTEGFFTYPTNTGYFGQVTLSAVKAYQTAHGISPTGIVDAATRATLNGSTSDEMSLEGLIKLLITLGIIPAEKADAALSALASMK